jgi:hypothetical protein
LLTDTDGLPGGTERSRPYLTGCRTHQGSGVKEA